MDSLNWNSRCTVYYCQTQLFRWYFKCLRSKYYLISSGFIIKYLISVTYFLFCRKNINAKQKSVHKRYLFYVLFYWIIFFCINIFVSCVFLPALIPLHGVSTARDNVFLANNCALDFHVPWIWPCTATTRHASDNKTYSAVGLKDSETRINHLKIKTSRLEVKAS